MQKWAESNLRALIGRSRKRGPGRPNLDIDYWLNVAFSGKEINHSGLDKSIFINFFCRLFKMISFQKKVILVTWDNELADCD